jgi:hypothetical protein
MATNIFQTMEELVTAVNGLSSEVTKLTAATQAQDFCCAADGLPYYPPLWDTTPNPETSLFCDLIHSFAEDWRLSSRELMRYGISGDELGLSLLVIITAALSLPIAILTGLIAAVSIFILEVTEEALYGAIDDLAADFICIIYLAETAEAAKIAIDAAIDAKNVEVGFGVIGAAIMKDSVGVEALNSIYTETYTLRPEMTGSTCECAGPCVPCVCEVKPLYKMSGDGLYIIEDTGYLLGPQDGVGAVITCTNASGGANATYALDLDLGEQVVIGAGEVMRFTVVSLVNQISCVGSRDYHLIDNSQRGDYHPGPVYDPGSGWTQFHSGTWIPRNLNGGTIVLNDLPGPKTVQYVRLRWQMTYQCGANNLNKYAIIDSVCYEII